MKYSYGVIHAVVWCEDCDWKTGSYKNAQAIAKIHAQHFKHNVSGELGISFSYHGRKEVGEHTGRDIEYARSKAKVIRILGDSQK
jgi:hypothetical protein